MYKSKNLFQNGYKVCNMLGDIILSKQNRLFSHFNFDKLHNCLTFLLIKSKPSAKA